MNKVLTNELVKMKRKYHKEQDQRIEMITQAQPEPAFHFEHGTMPWDQFRFNKDSDRARECSEQQHMSITERIGIPLKTRMCKKTSTCNANVFEFDASAHSVFHSYSHPNNAPFHGINILSLL